MIKKTMESISPTHRSLDTLRKVTQPLDDAISSVKQLMDTTIRTATQRLEPFIDSLTISHGKLIRSILLLSTAVSTGEITHLHIKAATAIELLHYASLIHDDVIDQADLRRSEPSINTVLGNKNAVLMGDFILCRGLNLLASLGDTLVFSKVTKSMGTVVEGELLQSLPATLTEADYIQIIEQKTAEIFGLTMFLGSYINCKRKYTARIWEKIGQCIGMAFQIMDDVIDLREDTAHSGKTAGRDINSGTFTLPIIYLIDTLPGNKRENFIRRLKNKQISPRAIRDKLISSASLQRVRLSAQTYLNKATAHYASLNLNAPCPVIDCLIRIILNEIYI